MVQGCALRELNRHTFDIFSFCYNTTHTMPYYFRYLGDQTSQIYVDYGKITQKNYVNFYLSRFNTGSLDNM